MKSLTSDYWNPLKTRFGVRVLDGRCWTLFQIADGEPSTFGEPYQIPVNVWKPPAFFHQIIDLHRSDCPSSDLHEVLAGKKTLEEAISPGTEIQPKAMSAAAAVARF